MKCSSCGNELPINAQFCDNCGQKIEINPDDNPKSYCQNCGAEIEYSDDFCGSCGSPVKTAVQTGKKEMFCGNCGAKIDDETKFCGNCGAIVQDVSYSSNNNSQHESPQKKKMVLPCIIAALAIILFIAIGIASYIHYNTQHDEEQNHIVTEQARDISETSIDTPSTEPTREEGNSVDTSSISESNNDLRESLEEAEAILPPVFKTATASSVRSSQKDSSGKLNDYSPDNVLDRDPSTCWAMDLSTGITPEITIRADEKQHVSGIKFSDGYFKSEEVYMKNRRITDVKIMYEGGYYEYSCGTSGQFLLMQDVQFAEPVDTSYITIQVLNSVSGIYNDICISEIEAY